MPDTARTLSELQVLLATNTTRAISAQDLRDFLASVNVARVGTAAASRSWTTDDEILWIDASAAPVAIYLLPAAQMTHRTIGLVPTTDSTYAVTVEAYLHETIDGLPQITLTHGVILSCDGTEWLTLAGGGGGGAGAEYWEPLTNGDAANPELVFADGDVIMVPGD